MAKLNGQIAVAAAQRVQKRLVGNVPAHPHPVFQLKHAAHAAGFHAFQLHLIGISFKKVIKGVLIFQRFRHGNLQFPFPGVPVPEGACQQTPEGLRIGFADRSSEIATIRRTALRLAAVGVLALAAFGAVSVFLARWALRPVEQAWQQQRQFVADASHELKTPLTVILASAELMARHPEQTAAQQRQWLDSIREEGGRMKQLIEDLLFLTRADALRTPELSAVDWSEITESAALAFESVSFEQGVALDVDIAPGLTVLGSAPQLTQLAEILLDNACKYAAGSRHVTLMLRPAGSDGVLTVSSTGETLTQEQLSHLFERFYRADPARAAGGHGLGLAIAQSIAHTHRGRIKAQSAGGVTTFTVTLPLHV